MADMFENVAVKFKNSPSALILFLVSFAMLVVGINHFAEDVYSSYMGLLSIEEYFKMNVQIFDWTYWTMSVSAQLASIVCYYIYLANTNKKWALWVSFGAQAVDFLADLWYRSNGAVFTNWGVTISSALVTFFFFTLGSEVFVTWGAGLCLKLAAPALHSWKYFRLEIDRVKKSFDTGRVSKTFGDEQSRPIQPNRPIQPKRTSFDPELAKRMGFGERKWKKEDEDHRNER